MSFLRLSHCHFSSTKVVNFAADNAALAAENESVGATDTDTDSASIATAFLATEAAPDLVTNSSTEAATDNAANLAAFGSKANVREYSNATDHAATTYCPPRATFDPLTCHSMYQKIVRLPVLGPVRITSALHPTHLRSLVHS